MINLCPPAIIYLIFSITQILIDTFKELYNTAFIKFIVMIMITLLLNILCKSGLGVISWIIVFIPFILMTVIVSMLLYVFGLNPTTGSLNYSSNTKNKKNVSIDQNGNIIIFDPYYDALKNPVYYQSPNIIIPTPLQTPPNQITNSNKHKIHHTTLHGMSSSDPSYQS
jgi:hypothetical protein